MLQLPCSAHARRRMQPACAGEDGLRVSDCPPGTLLVSKDYATWASNTHEQMPLPEHIRQQISAFLGPREPLSPYVHVPDRVIPYAQLSCLYSLHLCTDFKQLNVPRLLAHLPRLRELVAEQFMDVEPGSYGAGCLGPMPSSLERLELMCDASYLGCPLGQGEPPLRS